MTSELKNQLARRNFDVEDVCESNEFYWDREDDIIYNIMLGMQIPSKESCAAYYHSDIEYAASAQAVEYANTHYDDMIELEEIFKG